MGQVRGDLRTLDGVDLDIPAGGVTALVGPSGAGKTSLLRLLNRLDSPAAGEVAFRGRPVAGLPVRELRRRVGFVFQLPVMFPGTVADNLRAAAGAAGDATPVSDAAVADALGLVGLDGSYAAREAGRLSGGERQRASIARALMTRPEVLLMDEPTSALDPEVAERLMATVVRLTSDASLTAVMVTHRLAEARSASDFLVMLEAGRVLEAGPAAALFGGAAHPRTRAYLASGAA